MVRAHGSGASSIVPPAPTRQPEPLGMRGEPAEPTMPTAETPTSATGPRVGPAPASVADVAAPAYAADDDSATPRRHDDRGRDTRLHVPTLGLRRPRRLGPDPDTHVT